MWGWHHVRGNDPAGEAKVAIERVRTLDLAGYVINAESEYEQPGRETAALQFISTLCNSLKVPIGLCSYHFPNFHPDFPWSAFLEGCAYQMPKVFWEQTHNAGDQLRESKRQCDALPNARPYIPVGAAYRTSGWAALPEDISDFLDTARSVEIPAVNFFQWDHCRKYLPDDWEVIATFSWTIPPSQPVSPKQNSISTDFLKALNSRAAAQMAALYDPEAVRTWADYTVRGSIDIQNAYNALFQKMPAGMVFTLAQAQDENDIHVLTWKAGSLNGETTLVLKNGKIIQDHTFISSLIPQQNRSFGEAHMVEQAGIQPGKAAHQSHGRQLRGLRLWMARGAYGILFFLVLTFFIAGFREYLDSWDVGNVGAGVSRSTNGDLVLFVQLNGDAAAAGILNGDLLEAINGVPVSSEVEANQLLVGKIGDPLVLTVLTRHQFPWQVDLIYAGGLLKLLDEMHLSLKFLVLYNIIFSCLLAAGVILCSPLVFFRRSSDWLVILVAFSMIAFASLMLTPVGYGTVKLHVYFMNVLIYMIGIVTMIIVFFLFPTGHFVPRWTKWFSILLVIPAIIDFINILTVNNYLLDFILWIPFMVVGAIAQIHRYKRVSSPVERQQTKRVVLGAVACFGIIAILDLASILLPSHLTNAQFIFFTLLVKAGSTLPILILELSFVLAIYRYRLWDTDLYINRTVVYTLVTLFLVLIWVITSQVLNYASQQLLDKQAGWLSAILSSLQIAVIYKPVRNWAEKWVNKRFYRDRIRLRESPGGASTGHVEFHDPDGSGAYIGHKGAGVAAEHQLRPFLPGEAVPDAGRSPGFASLRGE